MFNKTYNLVTKTRKKPHACMVRKLADVTSFM